MALSNGPNLGLLINGLAGEEHLDELLAQWRGLDLLVQPRVLDKDLTAPPGSPADGAAYIVGAAATGAWSTHSGKLARYSSAVTAWEFYAPKSGWSVYVVDESKEYRYSGSAWVDASASGGVALNTVNVFTKNQSVQPVVNAAATGTYTADASLTNNWLLTMTGNLTLANPTNLTAGMTLNFCLDQDATGGRTITLGNLFKWPGGTVPTWNTTANGKNFFSGYYDGTIIRCGGGAGYA